MTVSDEDLNAYIEEDLKLSTTELHSIAAELQQFRLQREKRKHVEKWHCSWCGKDRVKAPEWEQNHFRNGWEPLCSYCANKRLRNPFNALLDMRKISSTLD